MVDLHELVAVVTGAGSGIGREAAILLSAAGAAVACVDRDGEAAAATVATIKSQGGKAQTVPLDVTDRMAVDDAIAELGSSFGRLDVCCNAAGVLPPRQLVVDYRPGELEAVLAVNLLGTVHVAAAAARVMMPRRRGTIINFSSGAIDLPAPGIAGYAMSKAGVAQFTRTLAVELAEYTIRVNSIAPGFVPTPLTAARFRGIDGKVDESAFADAQAAVAKQSPLGLASASDVARAVLYLASPLSAFVTGQAIRPNGGIAMV